MTRRLTLLGAVALAVSFAASGGAGAQETPPVVATDDVELSTAADGVSTFSATVTITGADGPIVLSIVVDGAQPDACVPLSQPVLRPGVATPISLKLPNTCQLADPVSVEFVTYPLGNVDLARSGTRVTLDVEIDDPAPAYVNLQWGFGLGALAAIVFTGAAWWLGPDAQWRVWRRRPWPMRLVEGLPGLNGKWTWESSQLTSITVVAALFTGLLGSTDVLEQVLGDSGDGSIAVVVVASALAAALVAAAPFMLAILRDEPASYGTTDAPNNYRAIGVLFGTALVEVASVGLILSIAWTLWDGSEVPHVWIATGAGVAAVLAIVYGARSMRRTLKIGMVESKAEAAVRMAEEAVRKAGTGRMKAALETAQMACDAATEALQAANVRLDRPAAGRSVAEEAVEYATTSHESACAAVVAERTGAAELVKKMAADVVEAITAVDAAMAAEAAEGGRPFGAAEARETYRESAMP